MGIVEAGGLEFGRGRPKVCVPLTEGALPGLLEEAAYAAALPADLYEWRLDGFEGSVEEAMPQLAKALGGRPLLCTLRTQKEGGACPLGPDEYEKQLAALLELGGFQLIDIELSQGRQRVERLVRLARGKGIATVVSQHDFNGTPLVEDMVATLVEMAGLGAHLPKLAVMSHCPEDVLDLLAATLEASRQVGPVVTMAMGPMGKLSRAAGGLFGSCMTFGAGKNVSAPGQIRAQALQAMLGELSL